MKNKCIVILISCFVLGLSLWNLFVETPNYSNSERRKLADFPETNVETILTGEFSGEFETYAVERFAFRDLWRSVKAYAATNLFMVKDNNGIYQAEGHISKIEYPMNEAMLDHALDVFGKVNDLYLKNQEDAEIYVAVIPDKNRFLAETHGYLTMDYDVLSSYIKGGMDFAEYIEIADLLESADYYKTDSHWRQEKIVDVAARLLEGMNGSAPAVSYDEKKVEHPFEGVYLGQSALACEADSISYLTNDVIEQATVTLMDEKMSEVYDMDLASGRDGYEMFLSGNQPIVKIKNAENEDGRRLLLFRDSFGSSIAPLLMEEYSEVVLIDLRYIRSDMLEEYVSFENADVLFLYSTMLLNNSLALK